MHNLYPFLVFELPAIARIIRHSGINETGARMGAQDGRDCWFPAGAAKPGDRDRAWSDWPGRMSVCETVAIVIIARRAFRSDRLAPSDGAPVARPGMTGKGGPDGDYPRFPFCSQRRGKPRERPAMPRPSMPRPSMPRRMAHPPLYPCAACTCPARTPDRSGAGGALQGLPVLADGDLAPPQFADGIPTGTPREPTARIMCGPSRKIAVRSGPQRPDPVRRDRPNVQDFCGNPGGCGRD